MKRRNKFRRSVYLPPEEWAGIAAAALAEDRSASYVIRRACREWLAPGRLTGDDKKVQAAKAALDDHQILHEKDKT